jgi:phenylalanyl-tRNA synthetase alpha subunit
LRFESDGAAPSRLIVRTAAESITFIRADTAALAPAQLAEYGGDYRSDEVDATHTWKVEDDQLVLYMNGRRQDLGGTTRPGSRSLCRRPDGLACH